MLRITKFNLAPKLKWHQLYYLLALIDILTIVAALSLTEVLMNTYESSVAENKKMSTTVSEFIKLGYIAQNVNEPGNRVFKSKNISAETLALEQNLLWFNTAFEHASNNLTQAFSRQDINLIQEYLLQLQVNMQLMVNETYHIFSAIDKNQTQLAGRHMSTMDGYYYQVAQAIGDISQFIADIQNLHFKQQIQKAKSVKRYEIAIAIAVLIIIALVTIYGHKLGKKIQENEQRIKKSLESAEHSAKAKSQFLANMSHEIRTPMNAILGMLKLIDPSRLPNETKTYLQLVSTSADNLLTIINDILDLSKVDSNQIQLEQTPFNLIDTLQQQMDLFQVANQNKDLIFSANLAQVTTPLLLGDQTRLSQVINNLLNNAYKFTQQGEISLIARTKQVNDDIEITIAIKDTGIGIKAEQQQAIFNLFAQADSSTTRQYGGTGLGLAIAKKICQLMSGDLTVASTFGQGSCFTARLLMKQASQVPLAKPKTAAVRFAPLKLHLLIAEDNRVNQVLIKKLLENMGCTFDVANNGQEVLEALSNRHQAILMDCAMPILDGFKATEKIRSLSSSLSTIPIIAVTANSMLDDQKKCLQAGMNSYISKPIAFEKLYLELEKIAEQTHE